MGAHLVAASLIKAKLTKALLRNADFGQANLSQADLTGADLAGAQFVETQLSEAKISGCSVYAINVWDLKGEISEQKDLRITRNSQPAITVDNIEVAQFIYLVLNNEKLRDVINTITSKSVLILGRFKPSGRKEILNALRNKLRDYNVLPIVFDFDRPADRDFTETIKTLRYSDFRYSTRSFFSPSVSPSARKAS